MDLSTVKIRRLNEAEADLCDETDCSFNAVWLISTLGVEIALCQKHRVKFQSQAGRTREARPTESGLDKITKSCVIAGSNKLGLRIVIQPAGDNVVNFVLESRDVDALGDLRWINVDSWTAETWEDGTPKTSHDTDAGMAMLLLFGWRT